MVVPPRAAAPYMPGSQAIPGGAGVDTEFVVSAATRAFAQALASAPQTPALMHHPRAYVGLYMRAPPLPTLVAPSAADAGGYPGLEANSGANHDAAEDGAYQQELLRQLAARNAEATAAANGAPTRLVGSSSSRPSNASQLNVPLKTAAAVPGGSTGDNELDALLARPKWQPSRRASTSTKAARLPPLTGARGRSCGARARVRAAETGATS